MKAFWLIFLNIVVTINCQNTCGNPGGTQDDANFGKFPWMAGVLNKEQKSVYMCSASIIHPQVVLTLANCVAEKQNQLIVQAGDIKDELLRDVTNVIIHPEYKADDLSLNNIALLILGEPLSFSNQIGSVCLPSKDEALGKSCFLSGYWTQSKPGKEKYVTVLQKTDESIPVSDVVLPEDCSKLHSKHFNSKENFICVSGKYDHDSCTKIKGEGGPLACPIPGKSDQYYQRGIIVWWIGCGNTDIYYSIALFKNWIDNEMKKLNFDNSMYTY